MHFQGPWKARGVLEHPAQRHPLVQEDWQPAAPAKHQDPSHGNTAAHCFPGVILCAGTGLGQALLHLKPSRFNCLSFFSTYTRCLNAVEYAICWTLNYCKISKCKGKKKKQHLKIDFKILKLFMLQQKQAESIITPMVAAFLIIYVTARAKTNILVHFWLCKISGWKKNHETYCSVQ